MPVMLLACQQGVVEILAAMAPCARLYGYLGCQLARTYPAMEHAYAGWVQLYSSDSYLVGGTGTGLHRHRGSLQCSSAIIISSSSSSSSPR